MFKYSRKVFYYETDKMGVVHHSNFLRWCEEARCEFLREMGFPFESIEESGILSPVFGINFRFKNPARFGDTFTVISKITKYGGASFNIHYDIISGDETILAQGESEHCFTNLSGRPIALKKVLPQVHEKLLSFYDAMKAQDLKVKGDE